MSSHRPPLSELSKIGFNARVQADGRQYHVQTEVLARDEIAIRTTVLEAGTVRFAESRPAPDGLDDISRFSAFVEDQHDHYVDQLESAGEKWLASISRTK